MPMNQPPPTTPQRAMRTILLTGLAAITLVLGINAYDSGIFKGPLFVLTALLLAASLPAAVMIRGSVQVTRSPADIPVAGLAALSMLGLLIAPVHPLARQAALHVLSCTAFFFAGTQCFDTRKHIRTFLTVVMWLGGAVAVFGLAEYFFAEQLPLDFFHGPDRRIGSTLGSPAFLGGWVVLILPLILSTALNDEGTRWKRRLAGILCVMLFGVLLLTRSRSSVIGCGASLVLLFVLRSQGARVRPALIGPLLLLVSAVLVFLLVPGARDRVFQIFDPVTGSTLARRWFFWEAGARAFLASPIWGHGAGSFEPVMIRFRSPDYWIARSEDVVPHAHNEIIETAAELGLAGLVLLGWFLWTLLRSGLGQAKNTEGWRRPPATGLLCGIVGLALDNLANVSARQAPVAALAWVFAGILVAMPPVHGGGLHRVTFRAPRWLMSLCLTLCAGLLILHISAQADIVAADQHMIAAFSLINHGEDARAVEQLRMASTLNPFHYLARSTLAGELLRISKPAEALAEGERLLSMYPDYPRSWLICAVGLLGTGRVAEAGEAIRKDIRFRNHPEEFYIQAAISRTTGDTLAERTALRTVLERCLAGRITMHAAYAASRLRELSSTRAHLENLLALLKKVSSAFPEEQTVQANLVLVNRLLDRSSPPRTQ
jgi:O-antigen ligase